MVKRLASQLPFAARRGSRAKEWLSFLAHAVADARPLSAGSAPASPLRVLMHAAAAAVDEQASALRNHPNVALYAAIARLVPGAGQYLEPEPCLVCLDHDRRDSKSAGRPTAAAAVVLGSGSAPSTAGGGNNSVVAAGSGSGPTGVGTVSTGAGASVATGEPAFLNYPLESIRASTKSTENAMLVCFPTVCRGFVSFSLLPRFNFCVGGYSRGTQQPPHTLVFVVERSVAGRASTSFLPLSIVSLVWRL